MTDRRYFAVLFTLVLGMSLGTLARAADTPSKRVLNVQTLYSYLVYPANAQFFPTSGVSPVDSLFSTTAVQGRIAPLGEGHDLATVKKYFFGLFTVTDITDFTGPGTGTSYPSSVSIRSITDQPPMVLVKSTWASSQPLWALN
jgi:hypothetical protein